MKGKKSGQSGRRPGNLLILTGLLFVLAALILVSYNVWDGKRADQAAQTVMRELEVQIFEMEKSVDPNLGELSAEREMPTMEIDGYRYIGYLEVPSISLSLPVMEEWDYDRLKISPCRYSGSVYQNDLVIAGHNYQRHFSPLRWQGIGTEILFTDVEGNVYHYEISDVEVLDPDQVEEMAAPSDEWDLTLFTCTIGGQTRHTIRCTRIS